MPDQDQSQQPGDVQVDSSLVIDALERQLGAALGQIIRLEVALKQMRDELVKQINAAASDGASA